MANIQPELNKIATAVYGRDVRGSIGDALKKINTEIDVSPHEIADFSEFATAATGIVLDTSKACTVTGWRTGYIAVDSFTSGSHGKTHVATIDADHVPVVNTGITGYVDTDIGTYRPITGYIDATDGKVYIFTLGVDTAYDGAMIFFDYFCGL